MKADKIILNIAIEVLSPDSINVLLCQLCNQIEQENLTGKLVADDGDSLTWATTRTSVEF